MSVVREMSEMDTAVLNFFWLQKGVRVKYVVNKTPFPDEVYDDFYTVVPEGGDAAMDSQDELLILVCCNGRKPRDRSDEAKALAEKIAAALNERPK